ncbi:MAG: hypothetical protein WC734_01155 [Patescibacteria group bacterium]|jgi:hypothetical protein
MTTKWKETVGGKGQKAIAAKSEELLRYWLGFPGNPKPQRGGFTLSLVNLSTSELLHPQYRIGRMTRKEVFETGFISFRKELALIEHPDDWTTVPSATPDPDSVPLAHRYYRGGLRCKSRDIGICASNLPWQGDLAVSCCLGLWLGLLTWQDMEQIQIEIQDSTVMDFTVYCAERNVIPSGDPAPDKLPA